MQNAWRTCAMGWPCSIRTRISHVAVKASPETLVGSFTTFVSSFGTFPWRGMRSEPTPVSRTDRFRGSCPACGDGKPPLVLDRALSTDAGVSTPWVVPGFDPLEDRAREFCACGPGL